jgi:hypothetical protein
MKNLQLIFFILIAFVFVSCGKKDEPVNTKNQSSTENVNPNNKTDVNNKWIGKYSFDESAKNVTGEGSQTWAYVITVKENADKTLTAEINVDGFQTSTRIEADVKAGDKTADFIFSKYLPENMFELYKKGDRLFTLEINDKNEMITNWDKMKANVISNQKSGKIMFKKMSS